MAKAITTKERLALRSVAV